MNEFTFEEQNLMCIYSTGSRIGLVAALTEMRGHLEADEMELLELTDSALKKLETISDDEFAEMEIMPDFADLKK